MTEALACKTCTPGRGGIPPLTREQAELFHAPAPDWQLTEEAHRIERSFRFRNFQGGGESTPEHCGISAACIDTPCRSSAAFQLAAPKIRSAARAGGRLFPGPLGSPAASSAAGPRAAISCVRACGRGGWLPPSPGLFLGGLLVMAAELHLAEDALALHLLLQHLDGLVDIVVTDENLHAVSLRSRIDEPDGGRTDGQVARAAGARICRMRVPTAPAVRTNVDF